MKTIQFKTNIKCDGCIATVTPFLNDEKTIEKWEVNTNIPERILTVETNENSAEKIITAVQKAGFKIEEIG